MSDLSNTVEEMIKSHNDMLFGYPNDDPRVNELGNWKDEQGITHIVVTDLNQEFALCDDGKFREVAPF